MANHKTVMWEVLIFTFYCTGVEVSYVVDFFNVFCIDELQCDLIKKT